MVKVLLEEEEKSRGVVVKFRVSGGVRSVKKGCSVGRGGRGRVFVKVFSEVKKRLKRRGSFKCLVGSEGEKRGGKLVSRSESV